MSEEKQWYAVYTQPRWEKKVSLQVEKKGIEVYCPQTKVRRKWSDRYKVIEEPLFKSYVFVKITEDEKSRIRLTDGVVNFVYWLGKPAIIKEAEIEIIKKFLSEYSEVTARAVAIEVGKKVRVKTGVLMDHEGVVVRTYNNRIYVVLESLGYELTAQFEKHNLEPLQSSPAIS